MIEGALSLIGLQNISKKYEVTSFGLCIIMGLFFAVNFVIYLETQSKNKSFGFKCLIESNFFTYRPSLGIEAELYPHEHQFSLRTEPFNLYCKWNLLIAAYK